MELSQSLRVHSLYFSALWFIGYFIWKLLMSICYTLSVDSENPHKQIFQKIWILMLLCGIWIYTVTSTYIHYYIYIRNNGKVIHFFRTYEHDERYMYQSFFFFINKSESNIESKFNFIKNTIVSIGVTFLFMFIILDTMNVNITYYFQYWYIVCCIPIFTAFIMRVTKSIYYKDNFCELFVWFPFVWILIVVCLQHDFQISINSFLISIPIILCFTAGECIFFFFTADIVAAIADRECIHAICQCVCCVRCFGSIAVILTFFIMFCGDTAFIYYTFIPVWILWIVFQLFWLIVYVRYYYSNNLSQYILKQEYGENIITLWLDEDILSSLNDALETKRKKEIGDGKIISLNEDDYTCSDTYNQLLNTVFYRLRSNNFVAQMISPNHVSLNQQSYRQYVPNNIDINYRLRKLQQLADDQHDGQYSHTGMGQDRPKIDLFQWIPTEFTVQFGSNINPNINCVCYDDMKNEYVDVTLKSCYIPDINQFKFGTLNNIILNILKTHIIPGFVSSICNDRNQTSNMYKQLLFNWCSNKQTVKIIIKSEQYEFTDKSEYTPDVSGYHIEGTQIEKISHVAIVYTHIDPYIDGGHLYLSFDAEKVNVWQFTPKQSLIIIFPNMFHKVGEIELLKQRKQINMNKNRRILTFFLCEPTYYETTNAYSVISKNANNDILMSLPLLTATDLYPLDKEHCNQLIHEILIKHLNKIPVSIISLIEQYILDYNLLRNEYEMELNSRQIRRYRKTINPCVQCSNQHGTVLQFAIMS